MMILYLLGVIIAFILLHLQYAKVPNLPSYEEIILLFIAGSTLSWITVCLILYYLKNEI